MLFLGTGQEKDGVRWLKSALLEDSDHRRSHAALADYYQRAGNKGLAQRHRRLAEPK